MERDWGMENNGVGDYEEDEAGKTSNELEANGRTCSTS